MRKEDAIQRLANATARLQEGPLDITRYIAWRQAAIEAERFDIVGLQVGDRVQVNPSDSDPWNAWFGTVLTIDLNTQTASIAVENNKIRAKPGRSISVTGEPITVALSKLQVITPVMGVWSKEYLEKIEAELEKKANQPAPPKILPPVSRKAARVWTRRN